MLITIFAPDNAHALEIAAVKDTLDEANRRAGRSRRYDIVLVAENSGPIRCSSGLRVLPDIALGDALDGAVDTLIVAGTYGLPGRPSEAVIRWIRRQASTARRYGAICTGAFLLGAAGLLEARRVTARRQYADALAAAFPQTKVEPNNLFVRDGPLFTSAGSTASIDLGLALVEEDLGRLFALAVARRLVAFLKRPGGLSQVGHHLKAELPTRTPIERVADLIRDEPKTDWPTVELASRAGMSKRNFSRVFRQETGATPADFVESARVETAQQLLEETSLSLQRVALQSGFKGSKQLRRAFLRQLGVTPVAYRARFYIPAAISTAGSLPS